MNLIKFKNAITSQSVYINPEKITHVYPDIYHNKWSKQLVCTSICLTNSVVLHVDGKLNDVINILEKFNGQTL